MDDKRAGSLLDIEFGLTGGQTKVLKGVSIKVFDAFRQMKDNSFGKKFIWGHETGVSVEDITSWTIISQYEE